MSKTRVTKPVEERRQEIIDTARMMFTENGFDRTQMADISKKMNVAAGTVYHYFKSKTELLYAVIDEVADENAKNKSLLLTETKGSAFDRLKMTFTHFENEAEGGLSDSFSDDPAIIQYYLTKLGNSFLSVLVPLIEQGNKDGSWNCEYPTETAVFILRGMAGVMAAEQERDDLPAEKLKRIKAYTNFVFRVLDAVKNEEGV